MSESEIFRFTFDGDQILTAEVIEDGETEVFELSSGDELLRLGGGVVHFEPKLNGGWEWTLFVEGENGDWFERSDGYGRITSDQVQAILAYDLEKEQEDEEGEGGDDDDGDESEDDVDGDGKDDSLIGGDRYRFTFNEEGEVEAIFEVEDEGLEEESISPDETYVVLGDYVIKVEEEDDGVEWEVYARVVESDDWIEVASGSGAAAPLTLEEVQFAIANEDGIAKDIEGDDDDKFEGTDDDDEFESLGDDGDDDFVGGSGRDRIRFEGEDGVKVDLRIKTHQDTGRGYDRLLEIEEIEGSDGDDDLSGNFLANGLYGGSGDDDQKGNGGDDDMWGELGDDSLMGGGGKDTLNGGSGHDLLDGGSGDDTAAGSFGNDDLDGRDGNDKLDGNGGRDTIDGGAGADVMAGGDDSDALFGGSGNDMIRGGRGGDRLHGGEGRDVFVFKLVAEGGLGRNDDVLEDFTRGQDRIDISAFDLDYIGRDKFSAEGDSEVRIEGFTGGVRLIADVDGDGRADFSMEINGVSFIGGGDLIL